MLRIFAVSGLLSLLALPVFADNRNLQRSLSPCIKEGINQVRRPRNINRVEIYSSYTHEDTTYYLARVFPDIQDEAWSISLSLKNNKCHFIGDDYVNDAGLLTSLSDEVKIPWAKRDIQERLKTISREQFLKEVEAYGGLQPYEYKAMRELNLID